MSVLAMHVSCTVLGTLRTVMTWRASFFVVQFSGFMSLMSYFDVTYIINITETPHIPANYTIYLVINGCVTPVKVSNFSDHYHGNCSTLDIRVFGNMGIL
jgi:hypothetical protein